MEKPYAIDLATIGRIGAVEKILEVICRTTGMGFSAVARVTDRNWVACAVRDEIDFGLMPGGELELSKTFCQDVCRTGQIVVFDDAATDPRYHDHPLPKLYGFNSYLSVPIRMPDGSTFGTLCAIDRSPASVNKPETIGMFTLFAELIGQHLEAHDRVVASEAALLDERSTAQLRDQFMAVLGHDLRNPLFAINSAVTVLRMTPQDDEAVEFLSMIERSVGRMAGLIDDVLDFARGRLGDGISIARKPEPRLAGMLAQVVDELRTAWPTRTIHCDIRMPETSSAAVDGARLSQMLSNLIGNALTHGDPASDIWVAARCDRAGGCELSVTNHGQTIPPHVRDGLFQPFVRGNAGPDRQGLGLGLYIASEIAKAHGGTLTVTSEDGRTCFAFKMGGEGK